MTAFAANSLLNRLGVSQLGTDAIVFAWVRVAAGATVLTLLVAIKNGFGPKRSFRLKAGGALALTLYMAGFSLAYTTLNSGVGALILFGITQVTMFSSAVISGEWVGKLRLTGAGLALIGLAVLIWPAGDVALPLSGIILMSAAGFGWGVYSLLARKETLPLAATASNFLFCLPALTPLLLLSDMQWTGLGILLAIISGGVTSGLGYALWYRIVPLLGASRAAVTQLSVPVIAALGGSIFLNESLGWRFLLAAFLVLGGISLSLIQRSK